MQQVGVPPQSQKPLDTNGYFSVIWHRFFMKMHQQMNKTNDIETSVNFSSSGQDGESSNSGLSKKIEELETRLLFLSSPESYLKKIEELEISLLFGDTGSGLSSAERNKLNNLSASGVHPYKVYDGKSVVLNNYEYLNIEFTGEYIIEGTASLMLNGNSFLAVSGGGI